MTPDDTIDARHHLHGSWRRFTLAAAPPHAAPDRPVVLQRAGDGALAIPAKRSGEWLYAVVSRQDAWACGRSWFVTPEGYVFRNTTVRSAGKRKNLQHYLHREVMALALGVTVGFEPSTTVDHQNRRPLDNRRENLRRATKSEQTRNQTRHLCRDVGVTWDDARGRWVARIKHQGREIFIGRFENAKAAIQARRRKARALGLAG